MPAPLERPWIPIASQAGFAVDAPKGATTEKISLGVNGKIYVGRKFTVEDPHCLYAIFYHDVPADAGVTAAHILAPLIPPPHAQNPPSEDAKLDGKPASKFALRHFHGGPGYAMSVRADDRVFTFVCTSKRGLHVKSDATHEARADKFFKSIRITYDAKATDPLADEPAWVAMAKSSGFSALAPKGTTVAAHRIGFDRDEYRGTEYKSEDDAMAFQIFDYDLPPGKTIDKLMTEHIAGNKIVEGPKNIAIGGHGAEELTVNDFFKVPIAYRSVKAGNRAYVLKVSKRTTVAETEYQAKKAKFFANFHIGAGAASGVDPMPGPGEFVKAGKVLPFWAAVVLPGKKELLAFSVRDPAATKPGGLLRRYSYPEFKLKATYQIPLPVNRAVADEETGRLYCASVNVYDKVFSERELAFAPGDIQVFDLYKLLDGKLAELDDVKPLYAFPIGTLISGLEMSSKEPLLYVSAIAQSKDPKGSIVRKGRLYKIDIDKQKVLDPINCADPVWSIRLSADGTKLYAGEMALTPGGSPLLGMARPTNVVVIDAGAWKRTKSLPLPAAPLEIALAADRIFAVVSSKAEPNLVAVDEVGDAVDVTPRGEVMTGARYLRTSADGKKLLVSGGIGSASTSFFELTPGSPPKLAKVAGGIAIEGQPLGGHFIFSPDGRYAILNSGVVIDLEKTAGRK